MAHITFRFPLRYVVPAALLIPGEARSGWEVTAASRQGTDIVLVGGRLADDDYWRLTAYQVAWLTRRGTPVHLADGTEVPTVTSTDGTMRFPQPGEPGYDKLAALQVLPT